VVDSHRLEILVHGKRPNKWGPERWASANTRYNLLVLRFVRLITVLLSFAAIAVGAEASTAGQTVLVVPFENQSKAPGIEWIGDSFPELLQERLSSPALYVLPREDRLRAYDRLGIPIHLRPSRATLYRIAEQMDVDYVVLGEYTFDGQTFSVKAQLLDMRRPRLLPEITESGPLVQLIDIQTGLSWDILRNLDPGFTTTRPAFLAQAAPVGLDAFESYVKGVTAVTSEQQIQLFREALHISPEYPQAVLQLGKAYYRSAKYEQAAACLSRVPPANPHSGEANFYLGLAAYYREDYARAESAFDAVAQRLPLAEIYNNLGVVLDHRDRKLAVEYFQKAVTDDPNDPDYRFNLGVELYRNGDRAGASRQLRESLALRESDPEAKSLQGMIDDGSDQHAVLPASGKIPVERLRTDYDESSFRQLALNIAAVAEQRLSRTDATTHAQFHVDRGHQLLTQGFLTEAEREFREAIALNPANAGAHAGLAGALEASDPVAARSEAETALRLHPFAEPFLVLARLDLRDNKADAAGQNVEQALRLDPGNPAALALKNAVAAKLAQEAPPLPKQ
jgi:tetratricopeptide (TPR) repeat protein/TolB-like protein